MSLIRKSMNLNLIRKSMNLTLTPPPCPAACYTLPSDRGRPERRPCNRRHGLQPQAGV